MTRDENTSRRKVPANRWSNIFQLFKINTAKPANSHSDSETSMSFRRRPSAMSDDSTLSSSASDEDFNKSFKKFHELYRNAVEDVSNHYSINIQNANTLNFYHSWRTPKSRVALSITPMTVMQPWRPHESSLMPL